MKSPQRVFLDWRRPALLSAVEYLRRKYASGESQPPPTANAASARPAKRKGQSEGQRLFGFEEPVGNLPAPPAVENGGAATWDLSRVIVVVPGRRAGRRLLELLVFAAREHGLFFTPPTITTEGKLPELLYVPKWPFADSLTQDLAWSKTLRQLKPKLLHAIIPHQPAMYDETAWLQLGQMLRQRHTELAADQLTFDDVVKHGANLPAFPDALRWEAMRAAQNAYLLTLDELKLWDIQTARLKAIEFKEIHSEFDIVLLGTVDLNRTMRAMLDAVAEHVTALIAAPESLADWFDSHGCVIPEPWLTAEIHLRDEQVLRVDGPADQADATAKILAEYGGKYRGDEISIGVPDEKLVPHLQRQLEQCGVPVRWVEGKLLPETGPYRLLAAAAELLRNGTLRSLAALVRHPDVFVRLTMAAKEERVGLTLLNELDRLQADYLVTRLNPKSWPFEVRRKLETGDAFGSVAQAIEQITKLLAPLHAKPQRLAEWSQPIMQVLVSCYGDRSCDAATVAALSKIRDCV
jgi:ATP-dependent helicase/nuclease subunit B